MFKKLFIMVLAGGLLLLSSQVWAADSGWTNMKFARFLAKQYGIQVTQGSFDEQYQALANALSQKGINYFSTANPRDKLTCCGAAEALYAVTGTKEGANGTCDLKIKYMVDKGIIKLPASAQGPCDVLLDVEDTFAGVEKFSPPREEYKPINPPDQHPDNPSSRI
jgi:hypothetical protein